MLFFLIYKNLYNLVQLLSTNMNKKLAIFCSIFFNLKNINK